MDVRGFLRFSPLQQLKRSYLPDMKLIESALNESMAVKG